MQRITNSDQEWVIKNVGDKIITLTQNDTNTKKVVNWLFHLCLITEAQRMSLTDAYTFFSSKVQVSMDVLVIDESTASLDKKRNAIPSSIIYVQHCCNKRRSKTVCSNSRFFLIATNFWLPVLGYAGLVLTQGYILQGWSPHWSQDLDLNKAIYRNIFRMKVIMQVDPSWIASKLATLHKFLDNYSQSWKVQF